MALERGPGESSLPVPRRAPTRLISRRRRPIASRRSRTGIAALVLPLEQHPRRRTPRPGGSRRVPGNQHRCSSSRCGACCEMPAAHVGEQLRGPVAAPAQPRFDDPDLRLFPDFDDNLRQAFRQETEHHFTRASARGSSVLDLLKSDFTYLNERLAKHYGIPIVYGSRFRRVPLGRRACRAACSAREAS